MKIQICNWKTCKSRFCEYIEKRINNDIKMFNLANIIVEKTHCMWECSKWPNLIIDGLKYNYCEPAKISSIITKKNNLKSN